MNKWRQKYYVYFKLTRSWGDCWSSCPILLLINKKNCKWYRLIISDIGLELSSHPRQWHWLTIDSGYETSALIIVLPKSLSEKFRTNFPSMFCNRTSFQSAFFTKNQFSLGPVFIEPFSIITNWISVVGFRSILTWYLIHQWSAMDVAMRVKTSQYFQTVSKFFITHKRLTCCYIAKQVFNKQLFTEPLLCYFYLISHYYFRN